MLGWLWGRNSREAELAHENAELKSELATVKAAAGELLTSGGGKLQLPGQQFTKAADQIAANKGWVFACVHAIASRCAGQAVHVGTKGKRRPKRGKNWMPPGVEPLDDHPLLTALADPNALQIAWSLWYFTYSSLELTGRCLWLVPKDEPLQIYPIPSPWLTGVTGTTKFESFKVRPPGHAEEIIVPADEACYFFYPSPAGPMEACSPLQSAALAITADENIQRANVAAFANGGTPKHALVIGQNASLDSAGKTVQHRPQLTGPQRRQLIDAVLSVYRRAATTNEPAVLDGLVHDIKPLSLGPAELDFLNSGKATKARITQAFGVNPIILGEIEGSNRASAVAAEQHLASTLNPKLRLVGDSLASWFSPRFGGNLAVWFDQYQASDPEMEFRRMKLLAESGALTVNELRQFSGLPAMPGGDDPLLPLPGFASAGLWGPKATENLTLDGFPATESSW